LCGVFLQISPCGSDKLIIVTHAHYAVTNELLGDCGERVAAGGSRFLGLARLLVRRIGAALD
jgi:hypothetical protein